MVKSQSLRTRSLGSPEVSTGESEFHTILLLSHVHPGRYHKAKAVNITRSVSYSTNPSLLLKYVRVLPRNFSPLGLDAHTPAMSSCRSSRIYKLVEKQQTKGNAVCCSSCARRHSLTLTGVHSHSRTRHRLRDYSSHTFPAREKRGRGTSSDLHTEDYFSPGRGT